jgi:hypothetical protein
MDNLPEIQGVYNYYCNNQITPIFIGDDFFSRVEELHQLSEESMRLIIVEPDRPEIDLSSKYFKSQIMRLLNTGKKTIVIRVWLRRNYFILAV